jgi:hypothetical protein
MWDRLYLGLYGTLKMTKTFEQLQIIAEIRMRQKHHQSLKFFYSNILIGRTHKA